MNQGGRTLVTVATLGFCEGSDLLTVTPADLGYDQAAFFARVGTEGGLMAFTLGASTTTAGGRVGTALKGFAAWTAVTDVVQGADGVIDMVVAGQVTVEGVLKTAGGLLGMGDLGRLAKTFRSTGKSAAQVTEQIAEQGDDIYDASKNQLRVIWDTCFVAGTPVLTECGSRPIDTLLPGDMVWARSDNDVNAPLKLRVIERVFKRSAPILELRVGGQLIETTPEHPFYVQGLGWRRAFELQPGDLLVGHEHQVTPVTSINLCERIETVYNIRVADDHTYFVGHTDWGFSVWVHNTYNIQTIDGQRKLFDGDRFIRDLDPAENADEVLKAANAPKGVTTPNAAARAKSQGEYIDPLTNKVVKTTDTLAADHIFPKVRIKELPGFSKLTPAQQSEVLNNVENFRGLPQSLNASKGSKIDWSTYRGQPLDTQYAKELTDLQQVMRAELQAQIDALLRG